MKRFLTVLFIVISLVPSVFAQGRTETVFTQEIFAMDTYMSVKCYGKEAEEAAMAAVREIQRLDSLLSTGKETSEVSRVNSSGSAVLTGDMKELMELSLMAYEKTSGAFDATIFPLMELWGFSSKEFRVPGKEEIEETLKKTGSDKLSYDSESGKLVLGESQRLDFGGIAKGYTSMKLKEVFSSFDIDGAIVSLGGNVQTYGAKPDGSPWRCGIQDPFSSSGQSVIAAIEADNLAVITSGSYERFFTGEDGKTYHHIIDPSTGYPAESDLVSVTIVSKNGAEADALSTACFVMGKEKAVKLWQDSGREYEMILITKDGTLHITGGLKDSFQTNSKFEIIY
ncbi:MAG: FAD:protein FMN transferase [Sphaerochaetaceae bacterium]|nr:FAD:protein FMN transferase [Sphaerochaetaceae bacterium]